MAFFGKFYGSKTTVVIPADAKDSIDGFLGKGEGRYDLWKPAADIYETEDGVVVLLELPGVTPEDIEIHIEGNKLTVRGTRAEEQPRSKRCYRQLELHHGPFERILPLPCLAKKGKAVMKNGILEVFLPRAEKRHPGVMIIKLEK